MTLAHEWCLLTSGSNCSYLCSLGIKYPLKMECTCKWICVYTIFKQNTLQFHHQRVSNSTLQRGKWWHRDSWCLQSIVKYSMQYIRQTWPSVVLEICCLPCNGEALWTFQHSLKGESILGNWKGSLGTPAKWLFFRGRHNVTVENAGKKKHLTILRRALWWWLRQVTDPVSLLMEAVPSPEKILIALSKRHNVLMWLLDFSFLFIQKRSLNLLWVNSMRLELGGFLSRVCTGWPGIWASWLSSVSSCCRLGKGHMVIFTCFIHATTVCLPFICGSKGLKCGPGCKEKEGKEANVHWRPNIAFLFCIFPVIFSTALQSK